MLALLFFLGYLPLLPQAQLDIRACCGGFGGQCVSFTRPEDLFGTACCGNTPFNTYNELCCSGTVKQKRSGGSIAELCCGTEALRYDQTCCEGVVHNVINGDCCGKAVYHRSEPTFLCCNGTLARTSTQTDICCGASVFDGGRNQICCGNQVVEKQSFDSCCERNDHTFEPYKSQNQFCCDGAQQRGMNISCCYIRDSLGKTSPQSFNFQNNCCKYPFDRLYPREFNSSCT